VDGFYRTRQSKPLTDFLKGEIGLFFDKLSHTLAVTLSNLGLAATVTILRSNIAQLTALPEDFLTNSTDTQNL
jgi:hypothetical protein